MHLDKPALAGANGVGAEPVGVAVIGGGWVFTSQTCRHVELEFHLRCLQALSLEQLIALRENLGDLRLLVVDESLSKDMLERPEAYRALSPGASIVLGYRDIGVARHFLHESCDIRHQKIGFLPMNAPLEVLLSCMRMLFHGEFFLPQSLIGKGGENGGGAAGATEMEADAAMSSRSPSRELAEKIGSLTEREREVLHLVSEGGTNKAIARELGITEHTVKLHIHNLSGKFGVSNRTAAANMYFAAVKAGHDVVR